jgi:ankyrin repeat protein
MISSLTRAVLAANALAVRTALAAGEPVDGVDRGGRTALHYAVIGHHQSMVELLVAAEANVNCCDKQRWTPLHFAAAENHVDVASVLIGSGAQIDPRDECGNTPLFRAVYCYSGDCAMIRLLIDSGANAAIANNSGVSPIGLANTIASTDVRSCL